MKNPRKSTGTPVAEHEDVSESTVNIDYIKGGQFRTIHPDGALGGGTPHGRVQIAFFCERQAIPRRVTYAVADDGTLGDVLRTDERGALVREIDIMVSLSQETASGLIEFIQTELRRLQADSGEVSKTKTRRSEPR